MISIIIPTKDDSDLVNTLESITKTKKPDKTEILIIDASKDRIDHIKKQFTNVQWIYYKNKSNKKRTFVEQLNLGTKKAKGSILCFVDGGCVVEKDWLIELTKPLLKEKENFVLGLVKPMGKAHHDLDRKSKYVEGCGTANTAIKKDVAIKVGERDINFSYGSDMDFSWRARNLGYKIRYVPKAIMYHDWGNLKSDIRRAMKYGVARLNLHIKHKDRRWKLKNSGLDLFTIYAIGFFLYIIFLIPVSVFYPYFLLLIIIPFVKNIQNNPIRKMIFDFFWGYGFIKRLFERIFKK